MSEIEKTEVPGTTTQINLGESQLDGTSQSVGTDDPVDHEAMHEQALLSDGVILDESPAEDAAEVAAEEAAPIANEVIEDKSFWSGFFGKP